MGPIGCPETSVRNCHYSLRNSTKERSSYLLRGRRLKSRHVPYSIPTNIRPHSANFSRLAVLATGISAPMAQITFLWMKTCNPKARLSVVWELSSPKSLKLNSAEQSHSPDVNSSSACKATPHICWTRRFTALLTRTRPKFFPLDQTSCVHISHPT